MDDNSKIDSSRQLSRLFNYACFYLKFRLRSKKEVTNYLRKKTKNWNNPTSLIDATIKHLEEIGLINDLNFIAWLVRSRTAVKSKGEKAIRIELKRFGVNNDLVDQYFSQNPVDDQDSALRLLSKSWQRFSELPEKIRFQKAIQFLLRRGYSFSCAKEAYNQVRESEVDNT